MAADKTFVGVNELEARYGPKASWWYTQAAAERLPHFKLGKYLRFDLSEVEAWLEQQRRGPKVS
jgi:predicted DNA-binding transcriptional regulator AlpA